MKHSRKPALLILTSSFPSSPSDENCGYVREFARSMSANFEVEVLAPPDRRAVQWPADVFKLTRSASVLPRSLDSFQASTDFNELANGRLGAKLRLMPSLLCFLLSAFARALRSDVICSHWLIPSGFAGAILSRMLHKPHVVIEHSGALHYLAKSRAGKKVARFIVDRSDRVVVVSADLERKLLKIHPGATEKIQVVPMGITTTRASCKGVPPWTPLRAETAEMFERGAHGGAPVQVRTVLFIGRLVEIKGVDLLLSAMDCLKDGLKDVRLIVAGDGKKRCDLESQARRLSVAALFVGQVRAPERAALFSSCDVVAIPSRVLEDGRSEGAPVVCLEAMAAGRVIVAARTGGLADLIVDGQNGLLFDPGDHRMLREKLALALGDDSLRQRLASNARRSAEAYDWSQVGERFSQIITSALKDVRSPAFRRKFVCSTPSDTVLYKPPPEGCTTNTQET